MVSLRPLLVLFFWASGLSTVQAQVRPKHPTTSQTEAGNEAAAPGFSTQLHQAHRVANFLGDALQLNYAQWHALAACTKAERVALLLATTPADILAAQHQYLLSLHRVLASSQMNVYVALRQQLADTLYSLDGTELIATR